MNRHTLHILFPALICMMKVQAQPGNATDVWAFGTAAGVDFGGTAPVAIRTAMQSLEGVASVCDAGGRLLFYTEGKNVWNRNHVLMPNGTDLLPAVPSTGNPFSYASGSQQAAIAGMPGSPGKYYIFSLEQGTAVNYPGRLYYSVVDMSLDSGRGDVVVGMKSVQVDNGLTEKMTVVPGPDCSIWVLVRPRTQGQYRAYKVTAAGVSTTPVVSSLGNFANGKYLNGVLKADSTGRRLAATAANNGGGIELYDFDPATGQLSNAQRIDNSNGQWYGLCFSPDNSRLYASDWNGEGVYQFDLTQPTAATIAASKTRLVTRSQVYDLRAAKDGKIYFVEYDQPYLHVINFPNLLGTACQPVLNALPLVAGTKAQLGLPNDVVVPPLDTVFGAAAHVLACGRDSVLLEGNASGYGYRWENGDTAGRARTVYTSGDYILHYWESCRRMHADTFRVVFRKFPSPPETAGAICPGYRRGIAWVTPRDTGAFLYTWTDSAGAVLRQRLRNNGDTLAGLEPGTYRVHAVSPEGCDTAWPVVIASFPAATAGFRADTVICEGETVAFGNTSGDVHSLWDFGDGTPLSDAHDPEHSYPAKGIYPVVLYVENTDGCKDTVSHTIYVKDFRLQLDVLYGPEEGYITLKTGAPVPYTVIAWEPAVLFPHQTAYSQYLRSDTPRHYTATGMSEDGCRDSMTVFAYDRPLTPDSVYRTSDAVMPDAFSPNGDGRNDRFRPGVRGNGRVVIREFRVFDRWGKPVWDSRGSRDALSGWDGMYNGAPAPLGVYFYMIEMETADGRYISQKGDVTLIR